MKKWLPKRCFYQQDRYLVSINFKGLPNIGFGVNDMVIPVDGLNSDLLCVYTKNVSCQTILSFAAEMVGQPTKKEICAVVAPGSDNSCRSDIKVVAIPDSLH